MNPAMPLHPIVKEFLAYGDKRHFMGGEWVPAKSGKTLDVRESVDGQGIAALDADLGLAPVGCGRFP